MKVKFNSNENLKERGSKNCSCSSQTSDKAIHLTCAAQTLLAGCWSGTGFQCLCVCKGRSEARGA